MLKVNNENTKTTSMTFEIFEFQASFRLFGFEYKSSFFESALRNVNRDYTQCSSNY